MTSPLLVVLVVLAGTGARKLGAWYLRRLDHKQQCGSPPERSRIAASRRRAQGHLWLGGAIFSALVIFALTFGVNRPAFSPPVALGLVLLAATCAMCVRNLSAAYRDARRIRASGAGLPGDGLIAADGMDAD